MGYCQVYYHIVFNNMLSVRYVLLGHFNNSMAKLCSPGQPGFPLLAASVVGEGSVCWGGHSQAGEEKNAIGFVYFSYLKAPDPSFVLSYHSREFES